MERIRVDGVVEVGLVRSGWIKYVGEEGGS